MLPAVLARGRRHPARLRADRPAARRASGWEHPRRWPCPRRSPRRSAAPRRRACSAASARGSAPRLGDRPAGPAGRLRGRGRRRRRRASRSTSSCWVAAAGRRDPAPRDRCCARVARAARELAGGRRASCCSCSPRCCCSAPWGIWLGDAVVWPLVLASGGGALIWRQSQGAAVVEPPPRERAEPGGGAGRPRRAAARAPVGRRSSRSARRWSSARRSSSSGSTARSSPTATSRSPCSSSWSRSALILAPWWLRLARGLTEERAERIRSQERAEVAAHLHDSVLQTLALMQKRADDPREVAALARRQERELRAWLNGGDAARARRVARRRARGGRGRGRGRARRAGRGRRGRRPRRSTTRGEALVAAAREAVLNAVKFAPDAAISVYAEVERRPRRGVRARPRARASTSPRCPPTGAACASRCSGGWSATAAAPRSTRAPARAPRSSW